MFFFREDEIPSEIVGDRNPLGIVKRAAVAFNQQAPDGLKLVPDENYKGTGETPDHYAYADLQPGSLWEFQVTRIGADDTLRMEITHPPLNADIDRYYRSAARLVHILKPTEPWAKQIMEKE